MEEIKILEKLLPFMKITHSQNYYIYIHGLNLIISVSYNSRIGETGWYLYQWKATNYSWEDFKEALISYLIKHGTK